MVLAAQLFDGSPIRTEPVEPATAIDASVLPQIRTPPAPPVEIEPLSTLFSTSSCAPWPMLMPPVMLAFVTQIRPETAAMAECVPVIVVVQAMVNVTGADELPA